MEKKNIKEPESKLESTSKFCPLAKKFSPAKVCPFPGCNGTGNTRPSASVHFSVNQCPLSRDERKRERELLAVRCLLYTRFDCYLKISPEV